jgi:calcineurin-like phosphoesterase family protein
MVNILKFNQQKYGNVFFISDLHYCHQKLVEQRGFSSVEEMNNAIIENWNKTVTNDDIVFALGDLVLGAGEKSIEVFKGLLDTLNYRELYLMSGNHSAGFRKIFNEGIKSEVIDEYYRLPYRQMQNVSKTVYFIPNYYEIFVDGTPIVLSHYPIRCWNNYAKSSFMICGHVHGSLHDALPTTLNKGKILDVGWENFKRPINFNDVKTIMNNKSIFIEDHHGRDIE